jgi:type IV pilus assembly protein PilX
MTPRSHAAPYSFPAAPRRQQGAILFIALIVLVAMTLAGIALWRSVDTALGITGNMAFRQSAVQGADKGVKSAGDWLATNSAGTTLQNTNSSLGYFSSRPSSESSGHWFDNSNWTTSVTLANESGFIGQADQAGNVIKYIIHRMCDCSDVSYNGKCAGGVIDQSCALYYPTSGGSAGGSMSVGSPQFEGIPQIYYRITVRVDGPRNTVSVTQVTVLIQV